MARDVNKVSLGSGRLYIDDVEVGYLKGDVVFEYTREKLEFKPSGSLSPVALFTLSENCVLRAPVAELKVANLKLAMGVTTSPDSFSGDPSYNPASFDGGANIHDYLTFGGDITADEDLAIRFEHIRPKSGKKVVVVLYQAVSLSEFSIPFHDEDFIITDLAFRGLADTSRPANDQVGMLIDEE
jgi:hypothetical protein